MPNAFSLTDALRDQTRGRWVRLRTLTTLRWLAVLGQTLAVVAASQLFQVDLPILPCLVAIVASVLFNIVSIQVFPPNTRLGERAAASSMLFDLSQVSILLYLTGGLTNPFAALLLAPVTISATALTLRSTIILAVSALAVISLISVWHVPLRFANGEPLAPPPIYTFGVWVALTIAVLFMAMYARRVTVETDRMQRALNAAEEALGREQRLTAIGGLAAAAAHELGTPLATIKLVSAELMDEVKDRPDLYEDAALIREQADRCRDILTELARSGKSDSHVKMMPISALIDEAAEPHRDRGARIIVRVNGAPANALGADPVVVHRTPEAVHGLRNLVQNAVDFTSSAVWIDVTASEATLRIVFGDDGPGYPEAVLERLGDPYITSRARKGPGEGEYTGMGLGLFIAKTLLERTGARVSFANSDRTVRRENRGQSLEDRRPSGALVAVVWPRSVISSNAEEREALGENPRFTFQNI
ncbi:MAG: sensor histidine kinase RegB [Pikeienuella sp.]